MEKTDQNSPEFIERQKILAPIYQTIFEIFTSWVELKIEQHGHLHALDIGTGFGRTVKFLASFEKISEITTIDPSEEVLQEIKAMTDKEYPLANIHFRKAIAEKLPFAADTFEVAIASQTIHHFTDPVKALHEIIRVTKAGGWLILTDWRSQAPIFDKTHRDSFIEPDIIQKIVSEMHPKPNTIASIVEPYWYALLIVKPFAVG